MTTTAMEPKDRAEFEKLPTIKERAKWLLSKGVTAKLFFFPESNTIGNVAYSCGISLPGSYATKAEAVAGGTAFLAEAAGIVDPPDQLITAYRLSRSRRGARAPERILLLVWRDVR